MQQSQSSHSSFKIKLIDALGLLFRPPSNSYTIEEEQDQFGKKKLTFYLREKNRKIPLRNPNIDLQTFIITSKNTYSPAIHITSCKLYQNSLFQTTTIAKFQRRSISANSLDDNFQITILENSFHRMNMDERALSLISTENHLRTYTLQSKSKPSGLKNLSSYFNEVHQQSFVKKNKLLILFSHGNASDLGDVYFFGEKLVQIYDVDFLSYDYTGYGIGLKRFPISEQQIYEDLQNILVFAVKELDYKLNQIILWGFSLGSGPTIEIASRFAGIGGVILQAPLTSIGMWADSSKQNVQPGDHDIFTNISKIGSIYSRILIIHGDNDSIVNIRHSRMLYKKYLENISFNVKQNIWFIEVCGADHNDLQDFILKEDCDLYDKISIFIQEVDLCRECLEKPVLRKDWSQNQVNKIMLMQECLQRETVLISLLYEDIKVQTDTLAKQFIKKKKNTSIEGLSTTLIVPIDDLFEKGYPDFFKTFNSSTHQSIKSVNNLSHQKPKKRFFMNMCVCENDD